MLCVNSEEAQSDERERKRAQSEMSNNLSREGKISHERSDNCA